MATASVSITPECSICFEIFKTPKVLPCGHTFCLSCIERYICKKSVVFPCPMCQQDVKIPEGGAGMFTTCFILQTFPQTTQVTGTPTSCQTSEITDQPVTTRIHHCPNHSKKEVDYYCQTCNLGLCSKCIFKDHNDHKTLDLDDDSTREMIVNELSKSEHCITSKIEDLEKTSAALSETSKKLKSICDEACTEISEKTEKIIGELKENCEKKQREIRDNFDKNESQLTETRQTVMNQIKNIKTDLDTSCRTTEEPSLTLIYSMNKLQDLQKLCENMKTDIPPVTYVEWGEGSVKVCDILGSTETKPLYQSSEGSGPLSTVTKPLYQSSEDSGPISTVTKPLHQPRDDGWRDREKERENSRNPPSKQSRREEESTPWRRGGEREESCESSWRGGGGPPQEDRKAWRSGGKREESGGMRWRGDGGPTRNFDRDVSIPRNFERVPRRDFNRNDRGQRRDLSQGARRDFGNYPSQRFQSRR